MHTYKIEGTCAKEVSFDLRDGRVYDISFVAGCSGNLKAVGILADGMEAGELVKKLQGLTCGMKGTSCGDRLAWAIADAAKQGG